MAAWIRPLSRWQQGRAAEFLPMCGSLGKVSGRGQVTVTSAYVHAAWEGSWAAGGEWIEVS